MAREDWTEGSSAGSKSVIVGLFSQIFLSSSSISSMERYTLGYSGTNGEGGAAGSGEKGKAGISGVAIGELTGVVTLKIGVVGFEGMCHDSGLFGTDGQGEDNGEVEKLAAVRTMVQS